MIAKQIMATDTSIYMATQENTTGWEEESTKKYNMDAIAIMSVIGLGIFICGFLLGACVIWRISKTRISHDSDEERELENRYIVNPTNLNLADIQQYNTDKGDGVIKGKQHRESLRDFYDNDRKLNGGLRTDSISPLKGGRSSKIDAVTGNG